MGDGTQEQGAEAGGVVMMRQNNVRSDPESPGRAGK